MSRAGILGLHLINNHRAVTSMMPFYCVIPLKIIMIGRFIQNSAKDKMMNFEELSDIFMKFCCLQILK